MYRLRNGLTQASLTFLMLASGCMNSNHMPRSKFSTDATKASGAGSGGMAARFSRRRSAAFCAACTAISSCRCGDSSSGARTIEAWHSARSAKNCRRSASSHFSTFSHLFKVVSSAGNFATSSLRCWVLIFGCTLQINSSMVLMALSSTCGFSSLTLWASVSTGTQRLSRNASTKVATSPVATRTATSEVAERVASRSFSCFSACVIGAASSVVAFFSSSLRKASRSATTSANRAISESKCWTRSTLREIAW